MVLAKIISGAVVITLGISLLPAITNQIKEVQNTTTNMTETASTISGLVPLVFGISVVIIGILVAISAFKGIREDNEDKKPKKKNWVEQIASSSDRPKKKREVSFKETPSFEGD